MMLGQNRKMFSSLSESESEASGASCAEPLPSTTAGERSSSETCSSFSWAALLRVLGADMIIESDVLSRICAANVGGANRAASKLA